MNTARLDQHRMIAVESQSARPPHENAYSDGRVLRRPSLQEPQPPPNTTVPSPVLS